MFTESFVLLKFVLSKSIFFNFLQEVLKMKTKIYIFANKFYAYNMLREFRLRTVSLFYVSKFHLDFYFK